ncbi:unnamed protein product, partial [Cyprideis torosa]
RLPSMAVSSSSEIRDRIGSVEVAFAKAIPLLCDFLSTGQKACCLCQYLKAPNSNKGNSAPAESLLSLHARVALRLAAWGRGNSGTCRSRVRVPARVRFGKSRELEDELIVIVVQIHNGRMENASPGMSQAKQLAGTSHLKLEYQRDIMSKLLGVWRLAYTSDTFEAYMVEAGVDFVNRKLMMSVKPDLIMEENNGEWTMTLKSTVRTTVTKFRLGEEFTETRGDGVKMQTIITKEGENKLIQVQKGIAKGGGDSVITREAINNDTELLTTCVANSVTGIRKYNRLEGPGGVSTLPSKAQKRAGE